MRGATFILTLEQDVVISATAATAGAHASLSHVPGATLLGCVAWRRYRAFEETGQAFTVFHSGRVRFGDARPITDDGTPSFPVPASLHHPKQTSPTDEAGLLHAQVRNCAVFAWDAATHGQAKQIRAGHAAVGGRLVRPGKAFRQKTAINATTGRAEDGLLFGYEALAAGTRLSFTVEADDDVDEAVFRSVVEALEGPLRIGRSRGAEFGRATSRLIAQTITAVPIAVPAPVEGKSLTVVWALSDLCLTDRFGAPRIEPRPEDFGIEGGAVAWERTFLLGRSYSPWNGKRRSFDVERQVICQGSVIAILGGRPIAGQAERLARGIGLYREAGLGRVVVNPAFLSKETPKRDALPAAFAEAAVAKAAAPTGEPALIAVLRARGARQGGAPDIERRVIAAVAEMPRMLAATRLLTGVAPSTPVGPSTTQWSGVRTRASQASGAADLRHRLFKDDKSPCADARNGRGGWGDPIDGAGGTWRDWLVKAVEDAVAHSADDAPRFVALLAQEANRMLRETGR
ncbi:MAG: hypothetical protein HQL40_04850 [Alphaproteobacteria bacterium]|nr:hypothetical protein [Alphaproteobacteria bacterium]